MSTTTRRALNSRPSIPRILALLATLFVGCSPATTRPARTRLERLNPPPTISPVPSASIVVGGDEYCPEVYAVCLRADAAASLTRYVADLRAWVAHVQAVCQ